jgi:hypothetical protein
MSAVGGRAVTKPSSQNVNHGTWVEKPPAPTQGAKPKPTPKPPVKRGPL